MNWYLKIESKYVTGDVTAKGFEKYINVLGVNGPGLYNVFSEDSTDAQSMSFNCMDIQLFLPMGSHLAGMIEHLKDHESWTRVYIVKTHQINPVGTSGIVKEKVAQKITLQNARLSSLSMLFNPASDRNYQVLNQDIKIMASINYETISMEYTKYSTDHTSSSQASISVSVGRNAINRSK